MKLWARAGRFVGSWSVMAGCVVLLVCSCVILPPETVAGRLAWDLGVRNANASSPSLNLTAAYRENGWVVYRGEVAREDIETGRQVINIDVFCGGSMDSLWDVAFESVVVFPKQLDLNPVTGAELRWFEHGRELVEAVARDCERQDPRLGPAIRAEWGPRTVIRWRGLLNNIAASVVAGVLAAGIGVRVVRSARGGLAGERRRRGLCVGCAYDLAGGGAGRVCPECGRIA